MPELALIPTPANTGDERQLPRNIEAEAAFLGAILIDNRVVEDLPVALNPEHFFEPLHGRIFHQTMALIERNSLATPVALKDRKSPRLHSSHTCATHMPSSACKKKHKTKQTT